MLDNFSVEDAKLAVQLVKKAPQKVELEVSGGINESNIRDYALTGVNYISSGSIIHSARWLDLSMQVI